MTNVIAFPGKRLAERPPSMTTPMAPAWAARHLDVFFDLDRWQVSARGNRYLRISGFCITTFPGRGGWKWCIASDAKHKPHWSERTLDTERLARADAWEWLVEVVRAEGGG
jgi:hypothetical protein